MLSRLILSICVLSILFPSLNIAQNTSSSHWHFMGPGGAGGRISDIKVNPDNHDIIYASGSTGGIFKSMDGGDSWVSIFDKAGSTLSIGDMALCPSDPNIIWAGTGEASGEQSSASIGNGVYKSLDGGQTWKHLGLDKTRHISRLAVHPDNPEICFAAAAGARWGWNEERGLFRTQDGGKSWDKVLYIDDKTGMSDLTMHPDGKTIFASAYQQYRNAWAHLRKGRTSGLYRSEDGGESFTKLDIGYPDELIGRIAIAIAPSNPDRIYAVLESDSAGVYRSDDKGLTWDLVNDEQSTSYWYGRIYVNPSDKDNLFIMGTGVAESKDGGKTFSWIRHWRVHVDHHILWFNPENPKHWLLGNDGGLHRSFDSGQEWEFLSMLPFNQFYAFEVSQERPYWIYGGLQDNGVWGFQIDTENWSTITDDQLVRVSGGDGFWAAIDPLNPEIVYGESQYGGLVRKDKRTGRSYGASPGSRKTRGKYRFNWNAPYFISVHPPYPLYMGGNYVFKSLDKGKNWKEISDDLSRNEDLSEKTILGLKPAHKPYASMTALAESPLKPGIIYAGTDDGKLHVTLDDGQNWTDLSDKLPMPNDRFFTRLICSGSKVNTVYAAAARYYEADDLKPYLFVSHDNGQTWIDIGKNLPREAVVKGFAEHQQNPDVLFAGTHNCLYLSQDGGNTWKAIKGELPPVAIDDIKIKMPENHLILGTYGRGIIIHDDINALLNL